MVRFSFRKGLRFLAHTGGAWCLDRMLPNRKLRLESDDGEHKDLMGAELTEQWRSGQLVIDEESLNERSDVFFTATPKDLKSLAEKDQVPAKRKFDFIREVRKLFKMDGRELVSTKDELDKKIAVAAHELNDPNAPSAETFWRWWSKFRSTQCISKLVDGRSRSGRRRDAMQMSIFEEVCLEAFLTTQKRPGKAVWDGVKTKYSRINNGVPAEQQSKRPSRATIYRWLKDLHHGVVLRAREGKAFADRELRAALGQFKVEHILERFEIDHTPVDVLLICKITKLILGRPWLTLAIDRKSRMIVGFYISFHAPSAFSVLYCLRMAMLPKDHILARFAGIRNPWPARGIPDLLVADNGMELHADAVQVVMYEMGIEQQYCGVADPAMKGAIERLFRTVSADLFHQLPGTVFSNPSQRADYPAEKKAALDLETFVEILVRWIVDIYHVSPHRGLAGQTPLYTWQADEGNRVIELPAFPEQLETIVAVTATRTIFHYGIEFDNLRYNSAQLQSINHRVEENPVVAVRAHEHDVGYVHVMDPETEEFLKVPAVDQAYAAGVNRHVHLLVCAEARKRFGEGWRDEQLLEVKAEIQAIVEAAMRAKKTGVRKDAAKHNALDSESVLAPDLEALGEAMQPVGIALPKPAVPADVTANDDLPDLVTSAIA